MVARVKCYQANSSGSSTVSRQGRSAIGAVFLGCRAIDLPAEQVVGRSRQFGLGANTSESPGSQRWCQRRKKPEAPDLVSSIPETDKSPCAASWSWETDKQPRGPRACGLRCHMHAQVRHRDALAG